MSYHEHRNQYYDQRAAEYDDFYLGQGPYAERYWPGFDEEVAAVKSAIESLPSARVLDVGCGTGFFTQHLKGEVTGLDQSAEMLEVARNRIPRATFVRCDALDLPFTDSAFERVFASNIYGLLLEDERVSFLAQVRRVATELVILEASVAMRERLAEGWRERYLSDGSRYRIHRRYFAAEELARELDSDRILFKGDYFVMIAT